MSLKASLISLWSFSSFLNSKKKKLWKLMLEMAQKSALADAWSVVNLCHNVLKNSKSCLSSLRMFYLLIRQIVIRCEQLFLRVSKHLQMLIRAISWLESSWIVSKWLVTTSKHESAGRCCSFLAQSLKIKKWKKNQKKSCKKSENQDKNILFIRTAISRTYL